MTLQTTIQLPTSDLPLFSLYTEPPRSAALTVEEIERSLEEFEVAEDMAEIEEIQMTEAAPTVQLRQSKIARRHNIALLSKETATDLVLYLRELSAYLQAKTGRAGAASERIHDAYLNRMIDAALDRCPVVSFHGMKRMSMELQVFRSSKKLATFRRRGFAFVDRIKEEAFIQLDRQEVKPGNIVFHGAAGFRSHESGIVVQTEFDRGAVSYFQGLDLDGRPASASSLHYMLVFKLEQPSLV